MRISIRWALILGCLGIIWGMQILITSSNYLSSQQVLAGHARDIMQNIADLTMTQSRNHLQLAQGAAHLTKRLLASDVVGSGDRHQDALERYFLDQLSLYPHFAGIYVGMPNGDFFYVSRSDVHTPGGYRTKAITHPQGQKQTRLVWRDRTGAAVAESMDPEDTYDPRQRPWYIKALATGEIIWTDPYIFFTSQKPGITVAGPILRDGGMLQGIVGVDIEIDELSTFIGKLRIGKHGRAFLLNSNGDVVAFPDIDKIKFKDQADDARFRMVKIDELDDGLSKAAFHAIEWETAGDGRLRLERPRFAKFAHDGEIYNAMFAPFTDADWPWMIGVYLPENDYLGGIKSNRQLNYMIALVLSVVATMIGLRLSRNIVRPLVGLEQESLAIKRHDLSLNFDTRSVFKEIDETANAFECMKKSLQTSEEKYRRIFENIQDIYYEASIDGKILEVSPSVEKLTGLRRQDLIGQSNDRFYADIEDRDAFMSEIQAAGKVCDRELKMRDPQGGTGYGSITASLKYDDKGQPEKIIGSLRIVTDRKKAELKLRQYQEQLEELVEERTRDLQKSNEQLHQIQRMEGLGTLAGGVAHDFNNLLMGIQGNVSLLMLDADLNGSFHAKLKNIESCVASGAELTRQLLGFARGGKYEVKPLDFNKVVANTARMFGRTRKEVRMVEKIEDGLWTVMADQNQIEQVLLNLYINAWQAMPQGGNIYLETRNVELDEEFARPMGIEPGRYVRISVSDTGTGIDPSIQPRIFEPFFTTKEMGRGTGLGLASAYGIVKNHDGAIDLESRLGEGATFYIYLPASDAAADRETEIPETIARGAGTILLVDDEKIVLDVGKDMLESLGYRVLTASGGRQAMGVFGLTHREVDMVILDMIMPDMGGGAVFDLLKTIDPHVKVLLSSGYSLSGQAEEIMSRGCAGFIQKPFSLEQLSLKIRELFDN